MKLKCTHLLYLLLISSISFSQPGRNNGSVSKSNTTVSCTSPLTGVWRGFFTSGSGFFQEKYKYEVQIGQLPTNGIKGVTYSYRTTVFYGKASMVGMYTPTTKNLILKENKLVEVKSAGGDACLMTCYLEYSKAGNAEILEGTFTSINIDNQKDCGSGRVYLEKVPESDFYKEDFVKEFEARKKPPTQPNTITPKIETPKKNVVKVNPKPKTQQGTGVIIPKRKDDISQIDPPDEPPVPSTNKKINTNDIKQPAKELKERENTVAKVIDAEGDEIQIDLYDNGQIDDDTITVYHNSQPVVWKKRLSHQPISIKIKVDPKHPRNEFAMVADNLGSIPPNTALMVITIGKQRYDVFLSSSFQKNAVVVVNCRVPSRDSK